MSDSNTTIRVYSHEDPMAGATILLMFPNGTWVRSSTDREGSCQLQLHRSDQKMTVLAAAPDHQAHIGEWTPAESDNELELKLTPATVATTIVPTGTTYLPHLQGRLNPIVSSQNPDEYYLYADNIAINGGLHQPVHCTSEDQLHLEDAEGNTTTIRIATMKGQTAVIEYSPVEGPLTEQTESQHSQPHFPTSP